MLNHRHRQRVHSTRFQTVVSFTQLCLIALLTGLFNTADAAAQTITAGGQSSTVIIRGYATRSTHDRAPRSISTHQSEQANSSHNNNPNPNSANNFRIVSHYNRSYTNTDTYPAYFANQGWNRFHPYPAGWYTSGHYGYRYRHYGSSGFYHHGYLYNDHYDYWNHNRHDYGTGSYMHLGSHGLSFRIRF